VISTKPISTSGLGSTELNPREIKSNLKDSGPSFGDLLSKTSEALGKNLSTNANANAAPAKLPAGEVKFSNHAIDRMTARGISFNAEDMQKINKAVDKAAAKGSKDSLLLMNDTALIVSVKNKTIVTVMDKNALKENVFTNIDSTIVM
jgi:flagellar operon protein